MEKFLDFFSMEVNALRDPFSIQIYSDKVEKIPLCVATKKTVKVMFFTSSVVIGNVIAYPGTLKKGNVVVLILTNTGIFGAYGTLGAWGLYMFSKKMMEEGASIWQKPTIMKVALKVTQTGVSVLLGFLSQLPTAAIARDFHGDVWAGLTQAGGLWVPATSQYYLMEAAIRYVQRSPHFRRSKGSKMRLIIANRLDLLMKRSLQHSRMSTFSEKKALFVNWTASRSMSVQKGRIHALFHDVMKLKDEIFQTPIRESLGKKAVRSITQVVSGASAMLYFVQIYILTKSLWNQEIDSDGGVGTLSALSIVSLLYLVGYGSIVASEDVLNFVFDLFGSLRESSLEEIAFPKISKSFNFVLFLIAALPQWQTVVITEDQFPMDDWFGYLYVIGNTVGSTLFVYTAMKALVNVMLKQAAKLKCMPEEIQLLSQLEKDIEAARSDLYERPLGEIANLAQRIQSNELRGQILKGIDILFIQEQAQLMQETEV